MDEEGCSITIMEFDDIARRALFALRGLVKLQALVRGHLVRKQTTATLRCMHALIAIQVRARVQRIQMAEHEPELHNKRPTTTQTQRLLVQDNQRHRKAYTTSAGTIREISETQAHPQAGLKSRSGHVDNQFSSKHCSGRVSISKREHHQLCPHLSELTDMNSSRNHNSQYGEYHSLTASHNSSRYNSPTAKTNHQMRAPFAIPLPEHDHYPWTLPNYMANTESSRAKVRSHSEPKQRPVTVEGIKHLSKASQRDVLRDSILGELVDHMTCLLSYVTVDSNVLLLHFLTGDEFFGGLIKNYLKQQLSKTLSSSSSQSRADLLTLGLAVTNILAGLNF